MKSKIISLLFLALSCSAGFSQTLTVGQKCPDILLQNLYNYPQKQMKLSSFKADLIILDFWGYYCEACIRTFPSIDSLQKKFQGKIQFIAVNNESEAQTKSFFDKRKYLRMPSIPFLSGDTVLSKIFPREFVPWHVWLDKDLRVQYITFGQNATEQNITAFLNNRKPDLYQLVALPRVKDSLGSLDNFFYYSAVTQAVQGTTKQNDYAVEKNNKVYVTEENATVISLAKIAVAGALSINFTPVDTVILEVKDSSKFKRPLDISNALAWDQQNRFNYYLMLPLQQKDKAYKYMLTDIERFFNISIAMEKRWINHYVLVRLDTVNRIKTKGGPPIDSLRISSFKFPVFSTKRYMQNISFKTFSQRMQGWIEGILKQPFLDETNFQGNIDVILNAALLDSHTYEGFKKALNEVGLDLVFQKREKSVLVIRNN
ncbi:MAG: TlpA family protein disulfide reductase [Chitinophagaceae bacterium]|nr:TlpA family protein disulfide reductase [Chitinophagaceae bacterium]